MNETYPQRKSPRATFHDYKVGDYFVTICTKGKQHFFGKIINGEMYLSSIGTFADRQFASISEHYPYAQALLWVVMPNHVHAIIRIDDERKQEAGRSPLSRVVGGMKRAVTLYAQQNHIEFGWQSRYHDHIIRGTRDGNNIAEYITTNVARWDSDCFNEHNL